MKHFNTYKKFEKQFLTGEEVNDKDKKHFNKMKKTFLNYVYNNLSEISKETKVTKIQDLLEIFSVAHLSGMSYEKSKKFVINEKEGAIDSFYLSGGTLYLIQTKLKGISNNFFSEMKCQFNNYIHGCKKIPKNLQGLNKLKEFYNSELSSIKHVTYVLAQPWTSNGGVIKGEFERWSWEQILKESIDKTTNDITISFESNMKDSREKDSRNISKNTMRIIKVSIKEFFDSLEKFNDITKDAFFNLNVRGDVSSKNKNFREGFKKTLEKESDNFILFNNGITMVVDEIKDNIGTVWTLVNPQIINGQQTTRILLDICKKQPELLERNGFLLIKIIETKNDALISDIAKYSNSQSSIKPGDLISSSREFKKLNKIAMDNGFYLDAKQGKTKRKEIYSALKHKKIDIGDFIRMYISKNMPLKMGETKSSIGSIKTLFLKEKIFSKITTEEFKEIRKKLEKLKEWKTYIKEKYPTPKTKWEKEEMKVSKQVFSYGSLAITKMIVMGFENDEIHKRLRIIEKKMRLNGIFNMNQFKNNKIYIEMGIL